MSGPEATSADGSLFRFVDDYNPTEQPSSLSERVRGVVAHYSSPCTSSAKLPPAKQVPTDIELVEMSKSKELSSLSDSIHMVSHPDWTTESLADSLMEHPDVRSSVSDKAELIAILKDLKRLEHDVKKAGCPSLQAFISDLAEKPESRGDKLEVIESDWIYVPNPPAESEKSKAGTGSYIWGFLSGSYKVIEFLGKARGALTTLAAVWWVLRDPRTMAVINGLRWIAGV